MKTMEFSRKTALLAIVMAALSTAALAKTKAKKPDAPASLVAKQEKCCWDVGAYWDKTVFKCFLAGPGSTYSMTTRGMAYDACVAGQ